MPYQKRKVSTSRRRDMSPFKAAWVRTASISITVHEYNIQDIMRTKRAKGLETMEEHELPEDLQDEEEIENWDPDDTSVFVGITDRFNNQVSFGLTSLTWAELLSLKATIDLAFLHAAKPVRARDRKAKQDAASGEAYHARLYRQLPEHVVRKRIEYRYGDGIPVRFTDILAGKFTAEHLSEGDGEPSESVAEREQENPVSKDSRAPTNLDESLLEMGDRQGDSVPKEL